MTAPTNLLMSFLTNIPSSIPYYTGYETTGGAVTCTKGVE